VDGAVDVPAEAVATLIESYGFTTKSPDGVAPKSVIEPETVVKQEIAEPTSETAVEEPAPENITIPEPAAEEPAINDAPAETPAKKTK